MVDLIVKQRDEIVRDYQRAYGLRNPAARVGVGTLPYLDAITLADQLLPLYANAQRIAGAIGLEDQTGDMLDASAEDEGLARAPAAPSSGYVELRTSTGGATILAGDGLLEPNSGLRFAFTSTVTIADGEDAEIQAVDLGPSGNLAAGTVLQISNPRPGCAPTCTVVAQTDGSGLTGGANVENDDALRERIRSVKRVRPASGNAADYRAAIESTPGVQIESGFVYPALNGPGTVGVTFTTTSNSRLPSGAQLSEVLTHLAATFPGSDVIYTLPLSEELASIVARVTWDTGTTRWTDNSPWPRYFAWDASVGSGAVQVHALGGTTALRFQLGTRNDDYSTVAQPTVGQTIAFYDAARRRFSRKRIASFTGTGPWVIACDASFGASDSSYVPITNQRACPWSDGLDALVAPAVAHFAKLGPGEVRPDTFQGGRSSRFPASPRSWPYFVTQDLAVAMFGVAGVANISVVEGLGVSASMSSIPNLLTLGDFAAFPL